MYLRSTIDLMGIARCGYAVADLGHSAHGRVWLVCTQGGFNAGIQPLSLFSAWGGTGFVDESPWLAPFATVPLTVASRALVCAVVNLPS